MRQMRVTSFCCSLVWDVTQTWKPLYGCWWYLFRGLVWPPLICGRCWRIFICRTIFLLAFHYSLHCLLIWWWCSRRNEKLRIGSNSRFHGWNRRGPKQVCRGSTTLVEGVNIPVLSIKHFHQYYAFQILFMTERLMNKKNFLVSGNWASCTEYPDTTTNMGEWNRSCTVGKYFWTEWLKWRVRCVRVHQSEKVAYNFFCFLSPIYYLGHLEMNFEASIEIVMA